MQWGWEKEVREVRKERRQNLKSVLVVLFAEPEVSLQCSFEGMGGLHVTDVRRERILLLWSRVRERTRESIGSGVLSPIFEGCCFTQPLSRVRSLLSVVFCLPLTSFGLQCLSVATLLA